MRVVFRADASLAIGTGHVMRCLTLADTLCASGASCHFICREHAGNLVETIRGRGHSVSTLELGATYDSAATAGTHAAWLGASLQEDLLASRAILEHMNATWLVVDHYALDRRWEEALRPFCEHVMVIDDIADRPHHADVLLDQNLGREEDDYSGRVLPGCELLIGPAYAMLRPEFARLRDRSLARRGAGGLQHILVTMGGVDAGNATSAVLAAMENCDLPAGCRISVVMGRHAPWLESVRQAALQSRHLVDVVVDVNDMAERMAASDLAIGAAGSTSWERCALGLPSMLVCLADNQRSALAALDEAGAVLAVELAELDVALPRFFSDPGLAEAMLRMSAAAARITDGKGTDRVVAAMRAERT